MSNYLMNRTEIFACCFAALFLSTLFLGMILFSYIGFLALVSVGLLFLTFPLLKILPDLDEAEDKVKRYNL